MTARKSILFGWVLAITLFSGGMLWYLWLASRAHRGAPAGWIVDFFVPFPLRLMIATGSYSLVAMSIVQVVFLVRRWLQRVASPRNRPSN